MEEWGRSEAREYIKWLLSQRLPMIETQYASAEWGGLIVWRFQADSYHGKFVSLEDELSIFTRVFDEENEDYITEIISSIDLWSTKAELGLWIGTHID